LDGGFLSLHLQENYSKNIAHGLKLLVRPAAPKIARPDLFERPLQNLNPDGFKSKYGQ
jgi:hypothetical protein